MKAKLYKESMEEKLQDNFIQNIATMKFLKVIKISYQNLTVNILNGETLKSLTLTSQIRQRCSLIHLLKTC